MRTGLRQLSCHNQHLDCPKSQPTSQDRGKRESRCLNLPNSLELAFDPGAVTISISQVTTDPSFRIAAKALSVA